MTDRAPDTGPMLFLRAAEAGGLRVAATCIRAEGAPPPRFETDRDWEAEPLVTRAGATLWRAEMVLPEGSGGYACDGARHEVATDMTGDLGLAFVSCNGQEEGDLDRPTGTRNALWIHLAERMAREDIHLLLHGGDQIYADEVTKAHRLSRDWPDDVPATLTPEEREALKSALEETFFRRYATQWGQAGYAEAVARTPSLCVWDDHDICDGWGSLRRKAQHSDVARVLFEAAREAYLLFQFGCRGDERPEICLGHGRALSWRVDLPDTTIVAPDLRSTRTKRTVMSEESWAEFEDGLRSARRRTLVISSVPALGPRLSLIERAMKLTRHMENYEDDLRDQWQSYAHREEWQRLLRRLMGLHDRPGHAVTVLSGEIHLAMHGTMKTDSGALHQLVASGITHPPPPKALPVALGLLARLGEAPLPGHPIRLHPLPGKRRPYTAERNYLVLTRRGGEWAASWQLEDSGATERLAI